MATSIRAGDVLRVTEAYSATRAPDESNPNCVVGVAWAQAVNVRISSEIRIHIDWLDPEDGVYDFGGGDELVPFLDPEWDRFEVVPADEVPDHLWAVIARRALIGDTNGD